MENKNQNNAGGSGCFQLIELVVYSLAALLMYPKTAELISTFAPNTILGYTGNAILYGMVSALIVEGVIVAMKIKMWIDPAKNLSEWFWDGLVFAVALIISGAAQVFDGFVTKDTLIDQPYEIQFIVTWGVPLIPFLVLALIASRAYISTAPGNLFQGIGSGSAGFRFNVGNLSWLNPLNLFKRRDKSANIQGQGAKPANPPVPLQQKPRVP